MILFCILKIFETIYNIICMCSLFITWCKNHKKDDNDEIKIKKGSRKSIKNTLFP